MTEEKRWLVEWSIDVEDTVTALGAAQNAWEALRREDSIANVFEVRDEHGMTVNVDLATGEVSDHSWWVPEPSQVAELAEWMNNDGWKFDEIVEMIRRPNKYRDEYSKMLTDRAFDVVAKEPEMEELPDGPVSSVTVQFHPEAWVDDHAVEVQVDWDQVTWNVSAETAKAIARQLTRHQEGHDWDWVRDDERALKWCQDWAGPFTIEILPDGHLYEQGVHDGRCVHCGNDELSHPVE